MTASTWNLAIDRNADRFSAAVVQTLCKRAASICSNPDCHAITTGPSGDESGSITVGEAAHIYGAKPNAARYDPRMSSHQRSDITNAIWLCRNCHKMVDADIERFPAELLFEWRKTHEVQLVDELGKTGARLRQKVLNMDLEPFGNTSYLAQQIVRDKPPAWEYLLTAELLKVKVDPIVVRWHTLKRGLYVRPLERISLEASLNWVSDRIDELGMLAPALSALMNDEFKRAWGEPGVPGATTEILRVCELFADGCQQALLWEERVRFAKLPSEFDEIYGLIKGRGGEILEQVASISPQFSELVSGDLNGHHQIIVTIELPDGWADLCSAALERLVRTLAGDFVSY